MNQNKRKATTTNLLFRSTVISLFVNIQYGAAAFDPSHSSTPSNSFGSYTYYTETVNIDLHNEHNNNNDGRDPIIEQGSTDRSCDSSISSLSDTTHSRINNNLETSTDGDSFIASNSNNNPFVSSSSINSSGDNSFRWCTSNYDPSSSNPPNKFNANNNDDNLWFAMFDSDDDDNDDDDNDDDASDDGHSSMLSTAFVARKNRIRVTYDGSSDTTTTSSSSRSYSSSENEYFVDYSNNNNNIRSWGNTFQIGRISKDLLDIKRNNNRNGIQSTKHRQATELKQIGSSVLTQLRGGAAVRSAQSDIAEKLIVTALVTLLFEGLIGHVLEFLKIALQTSTGSSTSYVQVISDITSSKGIVGLWDGFIPWGIVQAVFKGAVFGLAHASCTRLLDPLVRSNVLPDSIAKTIAGGVGGGFQGYILSPTLLLKTRVMTNPVFRDKMPLLKTTLLSFQVGFDVARQEGLLALMKGANVFALKRVFDWSSRYYFSDLFESLFLAFKRNKTNDSKVTLNVTEKSIASLLGGFASTCFTLPLDVLVAKTQDAKKAGVQVSAVQLFLDELHEKGWSGLQNSYMKGFEARLLHVCLTTVVVKTFTPVVHELLFGRSK